MGGGTGRGEANRLGFVTTARGTAGENKSNATGGLHSWKKGASGAGIAQRKEDVSRGKKKVFVENVKVPKTLLKKGSKSDIVENLRKQQQRKGKKRGQHKSFRGSSGRQCSVQRLGGSPF